MSDSGLNPEAPSAPALAIAPHKAISANKRRHITASVLSALAPGAGQLLLGQRREGLLLLAIFASLLFCFFPLRLPKYLEMFVLIVLAWLGLSLYAAGAALLDRRSSDVLRPSKWWLLVIPLLTYVGFNLVFTPVFLVSDFQALTFGSSAMEPTLSTGGS